MKKLLKFLWVVILAGMTLNASGAVVHVTPAGAGTQDGSSWANALPGNQLAAGIQNAVAGTDFWVAAGTYYPGNSGDRNAHFMLKSDVRIYGGFSGTENSLSERNFQGNISILSGDLDQSNSRNNNDVYNVVRTTDVSNTGLLDGFTITGGNADESNGNFYGGGILISGSNNQSIIRNSIIKENYAYYGGGGIGGQGSNGYTTFENCVVENNSTGNYGAAIFGNLNLNLVNCIIKNHNFTSGIIWLSQGYTHIYTNCTFYNNEAWYYGLIHCAFAHLQIRNSIIYNNANTFSQDGIIQLNNAFTAQVNNSILQEPWTGTGINNMIADPKLLLPSLQLSSCSPAIDNADNGVAPATDIHGNSRPFGSIADIGAYEYQGSFQTFTPTVSISATDTTFCAGSNITFTAAIQYGGSNPVYQWKLNGNNVGTNSASYANANLNNLDQITCVLTSNELCAVPVMASDSLYVTVNQNPVVGFNATPSLNVCLGDSIRLDGTGANSYSWTGGIMNGLPFLPNQSTSYTVTGTDLNGCSATAISNVSIFPATPFILSANGPTTLCQGQEVTLSPVLYAVDAIPSTKVAVGLHKLKSGYTGPALRLRRVTDSAEMDFGFVGDELDIAAINTWLGGASGLCTILYDQSGNGNHFTQTDPLRQPFFTPSGPNGKPVLTFFSNRALYNSTNFPAPYSVVYGAAITNTNISQRVLSSINNNWLLGWWGGRMDQAYFEGWVNNPFGTTNLNHTIYSAVGNSSSSSFYKNGSNLANNSNGVAGPNGLGMNGGYGGITEFSDCYFTDLFVFNAALNNDQRTIAEKSIGNYYGTTTNGTGNIFSSYQWSNGATTPTITVNNSGTYSLVTTNNNGCSNSSGNSVTVNSISTPGDPSVFGNNAWNVYAFDGGNSDPNFPSWTNNYRGFFTIPSLGFNTNNYFSPSGSPSDAPGFAGCALPADYHSWTAKRVGFPCGYYQINLPSHDDAAQLIINGDIVYSAYCCGSNFFSWSGFLGANDSIEYRVSEVAGGSGATINFSANSNLPVISGALSLCGNTTGTLSISAYGSTNYLWSTGDTTSSISVTDSGLYTVEVSNGFCSFTQSVTVLQSEGNPSVYGQNQWNVYVYNAGNSSADSTTWINGYSGYFVADTLNFNSVLYYADLFAPSTAPGYLGCPVQNDNHAWEAKREGFPCAYYQIEIPTHDDMAQLWINDSLVFEHNGCCDQHKLVWEGFLDGDDRINFRVTEGVGSSTGHIVLKPIGPSIQGETLICPGTTTQLSVVPQPGVSYTWTPGNIQDTIISNIGIGNYCVTAALNGCSTQSCLTIGNHPSAQPISILPDAATSFCGTASPVNLCASLKASQEFIYSANISNSTIRRWTMDGSNLIYDTTFTPIPTYAFAIDRNPANNLYYGISNQNGRNIFTFNPETGSVVHGNQILSHTGSGQVSAFSFDQTGNLFAVFNGAVFNKIDYNSPALTPTNFPVNPALPNYGFVGLTCDFDNNRLLYATGNSGEVYSIDPQTGVSQYLFSLGTPGQAIAYVGNNKINCTWNGDGQVYQFDMITQTLSNLTNVLGSSYGTKDFLFTPKVELSWSTATANLGNETCINVNPAATTDYFLSYTNSLGCVSHDTLTIVVNPLPVVSINVTPSANVCIGSQVTLSGSGALSYTWENGIVNGVAFNADSSATYTVTGTDANGCSNTAQQSISVSTPPAVPVISVGGSPVVCNGNTVTLTSSEASGNVWSSGETSSSIVVNASGNYTVSVGTGCTSTSLPVSITVQNCGGAVTQIRSSDCGRTNFNLQSSIVADAVTGATQYEFQFRTENDLTIVATRLQSSRTLSIAAVSPALQWGTNYKVRVRPVISGTPGTYGNVCTIGFVPDPNIFGVPTTTLISTNCGKLNYVLSASITCNVVNGATQYEFEFSNPNTNAVVATKIQANNFTTLSSVLPALQWGTQYNVRVRAYYGSFAGSYGSVCLIGLIPDPAVSGVPATQLSSASCNKTGLSLTGSISCNVVTGANQYEWEFTNPVTFAVVATRTTTTATCALSSVSPALQWGTQYNVRVRAFIAGTGGAFGNICLIGLIPDPNTAGVPSTRLNSAGCGNMNLTNQSSIVALTVNGANQYEFEFSNPNTNVVYALRTTTSATCFLNAVSPALQWGTQYNVRVRAFIAGVAGSFGNVCSIGLIPDPSLGVPNTQLRAVDCGKLNFTLTSNMAANPVAGATQYEFEFSNPNTNAVVATRLQSSATLNLGNVSPALQAGTQYNVRVRAYINSFVGNYNTVCLIGIASSSRNVEEEEAISTEENILAAELNFYPNPFSENIHLQLNTAAMEQAQLEIYDVSGKLVYENRIQSNATLLLGNELQSGMYLIKVYTQNGEQLNARIIKK